MGVSGVSPVELGEAETAERIPREDAREGIPYSRRGGVDPVRSEEIGPGLDHEDDHRTSGTAPDSWSDGLPACPVNAQKLRLRLREELVMISFLNWEQFTRLCPHCSIIIEVKPF